MRVTSPSTSKSRFGHHDVNYHSSSGPHDQGTVPGIWSNAFHTYTLCRQPGKCEVYYDGVKVKSYRTDDAGALQYLIKCRIWEYGCIWRGLSTQGRLCTFLAIRGPTKAPDGAVISPDAVRLRALAHPIRLGIMRRPVATDALVGLHAVVAALCPPSVQAD